MMSQSLLRAISARRNQSHTISPISFLGANQFHNISMFASKLIPERCQRPANGFCSVPFDSDSGSVGETKVVYKKPVEFTKIDAKLLPTVMIIGRPNVGKSALHNRLIRRGEALVYNTPDDPVTRDIREGIAKLADLRFNVLDSAGIETQLSSATILGRTTSMLCFKKRASFSLKREASQGDHSIACLGKGKALYSKRSLI